MLLLLLLGHAVICGNCAAIWSRPNSPLFRFRSLSVQSNRPLTLFLSPQGRSSDVNIATENSHLQHETSKWPFAIPFVVLSSLAIAISYADRSNLSTAVIPMSAEYQWDAATSGTVLSAFYLGYALTQIFGGWLADTFGGEYVLCAALLLWSLLTGLTPTAAAQQHQGSILPLLVDRVLLGAGEGLALPAIHSMIPRYVSPRYASTAASVVTAACYLGAVFSNLITPAIISQPDGWQRSFYLFAVAPVVIWLPLWIAFIISVDSNSNFGYSAPAAAVESGMVAKEGTEDGELSVLFLLAQPPVWAIIAAQYGQSWGMIGLLSWLPTYFNDRFHVATDELALFTTVPYITQLVVSLASGVLVDWLVQSRGWTVLQIRRWLQVVGMIAPAFCLTMCAYGPLLVTTTNNGNVEFSVEIAAALITLGTAISATTSAAVSCNQFDLSPTNAGKIFGIGNTAGCVGGLVAVPLSGALYDVTRSWDVVLLLFALHYAVGALLWYLFVSTTPLRASPRAVSVE